MPTLHVVISDRRRPPRISVKIQWSRRLSLRTIQRSTESNSSLENTLRECGSECGITVNFSFLRFSLLAGCFGRGGCAEARSPEEALSSQRKLLKAEKFSIGSWEVRFSISIAGLLSLLIMVKAMFVLTSLMLGMYKEAMSFLDERTTS